MACHSNTLSSRCARGCLRNRKKRDSSSVEKEAPAAYGSRKYSVGSGPLTLSTKKENKGNIYNNDNNDNNLYNSYNNNNNNLLTTQISLKMYNGQKRLLEL